MQPPQRACVARLFLFATAAAGMGLLARGSLAAASAPGAPQPAIGVPWQPPLRLPS